MIIAFCGGIVALGIIGFSINSLTILGMIIVLGMLVDDAIVISENIYFFLERGFHPNEAAFYGVRQVAASVTTAVLTTIIAFFPLIFMKGIIGEFIKVIPVVVILMLLCSLLEALIILPIHSISLLKQQAKKSKNLFSQLNKLYKKYLYWSIRHMKYIICLIGLYLICTVFVAKNHISFSLFPSSGIEAANISIELQENILIDVTETVSKEISNQLLDKIGSDITAINTTIGELIIDPLTATKKKGNNYAFLQIRFTKDKSFVKREKDVLNKIRKIVSNLSKQYNLIDSNVEIVRPGPPIGRAIELILYSKDFDKTILAAKKLRSHISSIEGVIGAKLDVQDSKTQYRLVFNKYQMNRLGINIADTSRIINTMFGDVAISSSRKGDDKINIIMDLYDRDKNLQNILDIKILSETNQYVPLSSFITIEKNKSRNSIYKVDGHNSVTVYADIDDTIITSKEANRILIPYLNNLKKEFYNITITPKGEEKENIEALVNVGKLYLLAILGIFMVISLNMGSVILPFVIMMVIPFGIAGVVWALFVHNAPMSMMGIIGAVGMSGVAVNGAIILIKTIVDNLKNTKINSHKIISVVIKSSVRRLRPIIITTVTTLIGLIPTIYGFGGSLPLIQPMALVLGWGLFFATIFILLCLPIILIIVFKALNKFRNNP